MKKCVRIIAWSVIGFCYAPIFVLLVNSFNVCRSGAEWSGFTLKWYQGLLSEESIWEAMKNSIIIASLSTIISVPIGTISALSPCLFAYFLRFSKNKILKPTTFFLNKMILTVPDLQLAVGLLIFFSFLNVGLGIATITISHSIFSIVYVLQSVFSRLSLIDLSMIEAAQDLGAQPKTIITEIIFPLIRSTIIASAILAFTISIDEFVLTFFLSGPTSPTLPIEIYGMIRNGFPPIVDTLAVLMLGFSLVASWAFQKISNDR
ncbi:ABC transporter permease [Candidatus Similichlamydia epinepheli]|uniref:ABC transporter permease n=1 Tax=Candidatus Similichlamydia epinepheli TaxID=1903953 RepID=UPI001EFCB34D|nr:ABC transporter permease [Candidatus Similichlamydia epinepheli]